jgi:hypothetical protein
MVREDEIVSDQKRPNKAAFEMYMHFRLGQSMKGIVTTCTINSHILGPAADFV